MLRNRSARFFMGALIILVLALYIFPFFYLIVTSFKPGIETIAVPPVVFPSEWSVENYRAIFDDPDIIGSFTNSAIIATISTVVSLVLAVPAAYGITRYRTVTGQVFIIGTLITRMVPYVSIAIPLFSMMRTLGLTDTHLGVAIAHTTVSLPLSIWLMASFFENVPFDLEEAARVDGCNRGSALVKVILPMAAGGVAVTAIFAFLASWNEFLFSLLLTSIEAKTVPIVIAEFKTQFGLDWGTMTALATLYSFPVVFLALALQKRIVAGLTMGAVKG